jgi:hypothetical protein
MNNSKTLKALRKQCKDEKREARKKIETTFYQSYVAHLPQVPINAALERGKLYHEVHHHDDWCAIYDGNTCNCNVIITRHVEPKRS